MSLDEDVNRVGTETPIIEKSEIAEAFGNLDNDNKDASSGMSNIDFNARLSSDEISFIMIIDEFVRMGIFPKEFTITRQKKRLSVSHEGKGREEKVKISSGILDAKSGFGAGLGNMFRRRD